MVTRISRCVVTGAAGFIGSTLVDELLSSGSLVTGIDCFDGYYPRAIKARNLATSLKHPNFKLLEQDLVTADLSRCLDGADVVFHLAARPGVRASWDAGFDEYVRNNILATQRLLSALPRGARLVFASSSSVYGDGEGPRRETDHRRPVSPYGVTKVTTEELVAAYAREGRLSAVGLRYFTVYGPRQRPDMAVSRFALAALRRQPIELYGDGRQSRDMTFVGDVVRATIEIAICGSEPYAVYNVGGGQTRPLSDLIAVIESITGEPMRIERKERARGDVFATLADTSALRSVLGWVPMVPLEEGVAAQIDWLKQDISDLKAGPPA